MLSVDGLRRRGDFDVDGRRGVVEVVGSALVRAVVVIRVLITQIGFVMSTVALPAIAPAIIDSIVVSFCDARRLRRAAWANISRVHSYPMFLKING